MAGRLRYLLYYLRLHRAVKSRGYYVSIQLMGYVYLHYCLEGSVQCHTGDVNVGCSTAIACPLVCYKHYVSGPMTHQVLIPK